MATIKFPFYNENGVVVRVVEVAETNPLIPRVNELERTIERLRQTLSPLETVKERLEQMYREADERTEKVANEVAGRLTTLHQGETARLRESLAARDGENARLREALAERGVKALRPNEG